MKKSTLFFFCLILFCRVANSQNINPDGGEVYRENEIAMVYITMNPIDSAFLFDEENVLSEEYLPAQFRFVNSLMDTLLPFNVGIRLRGNTSRFHPKKSLKIKFKEFGGEKFFDLKKFNFKAENNDPSFVREQLSLKLFRTLDVPAARSHHVQIFLNGQYIGLYLNVEQIDDEFVQSRFGNDDGNLYKCSYGASLEPDNDIDDDNVFELETNKEVNDRSVLKEFVTLVNTRIGNSFETTLEEIFEVDRFLSYLAVEALVGHWDGYSYNQNNFYLYENAETNKIDFIPYDVDNTFGINWIQRDWGTRDVLNWPISDQERPLVKKILERPRYFSRYVSKIRKLLNSDFSESELFPAFDSYRLMLSEAVRNDDYFPLTFGFSFEDFENSYAESIGGHLPYGLKPYVTARVNSASDQIIDVVTSVPKPADGLSIYPNPNNGKQLFISGLRPNDHLRIVDLSGRSYELTRTFSGSSTVMELDLIPGFYLITAGNETFKLVVK